MTKPVFQKGILFFLIAILLCGAAQIGYACFAYHTAIETGAGLKAIENIAIGDTVAAASQSPADAGKELAWSTATVEFSQGNQTGTYQANVILIAYGGNPDPQEMIVTSDHLFMLSNGRLISANRLAPGQQLLSADGSPMEVMMAVVMGSFYGGIHHIATSASFDGNIDEHLINANGLVCGDYMLQIYQSNLPAEALDPDSNRPAPFGRYLTLAPHPKRDEILSITNAPGSQQFPDAAYNPLDNTYLAAWENVQDGGLASIQGVVLRGDNGQPVTQSATLLEAATGLESPVLAYNNAGNEYLLLARRMKDQQVLARRVSAQGQPIGSSVELGVSGGTSVPTSTSRSRVISVAYNSTENRYLVGFSNPVSGLLLNADLTTAAKVDSLGAGIHPGVSWSQKQNTYAVVWENPDEPGARSDHLNFQVLSNAGKPVGSIQPIEALESPDLASCIAYNPENDHYLVVWDEWREDDMHKQLSDVMGQVLYADGTPADILTPIGFDNEETYQQDAVFNFASHQYLVTFKTDPDAGTSPVEVYGRLLSPEAGYNSEPFLISETPTTGGIEPNTFKLPAVAANTRDGSFLVVWDEWDSLTSISPNHGNIKARIISHKTSHAEGWEGLR